MADMLANLESDEAPQLAAYFAHGSSMALLMHSFGYGRDAEHLRFDNYEKHLHRKYSISEQSAFGGNVAAVKYHCPNDTEQNKVLLLLNEKPLNLEGCNAGLCNLSFLLEKYKHFRNVDCAKEFCTD